MDRKVVIVVEGGSVYAYASDPDIEVELIDMNSAEGTGGAYDQALADQWDRACTDLTEVLS